MQSLLVKDVRDELVLSLSSEFEGFGGIYKAGVHMATRRGEAGNHECLRRTLPPDNPHL